MDRTSEAMTCPIGLGAPLSTVADGRSSPPSSADQGHMLLYMDNDGVAGRLRAAALELAAHRPDEKLTVALICAEARVGRDEFYRYASSPVRLVAEALSDELLSEYEAVDGIPINEAVRERSVMGLKHIAKWADVYRGPIRVELMESLRQTLGQVFRMLMEDYLRAYPEILPDELDSDDEWSIEFIAAYMSGGGMAAIESWVDGPDLDIERGLRLFRAVSPSFWSL